MNKENNLSIHYAIGNVERVRNMASLPAMQIFTSQVVDFFNELSKILLLSGRAYSDVMTFAFWCRKASLLQQKERYDDGSLRLGRGVTFHSTPSNVPVNFAFSFAAGLLAGNANIVRLPAKDFPQVSCICQGIESVLKKDEFKEIAPYVALLSYASSKECNDYFSSLCQTRIVWGGDETIQRMRQSPLPPRSTELTFANRFSLALIDADSYMQDENPKKIAKDFYNDTYFSDQNACTAPRFIIWLGKDKEQAKELFWKNLLEEVHVNQYACMPVHAVGKFTASCVLGATKKVRSVPTSDWTLKRVQLESLELDLIDHIYHSGFFLEYDAQHLEEILPLCAINCQTLSYFGVSRDDLQSFILQNRPRGIDRIVPMGQTMNFSLTWDGFDLIESMSRKITL